MKFKILGVLLGTIMVTAEVVVAGIILAHTRGSFFVFFLGGVLIYLATDTSWIAFQIATGQRVYRYSEDDKQC